MDNNCAACFRDLEADEPFASFDFCTNREKADHTHILEGRELMRFCIPCGYDRLDAVYAALMGVENVPVIQLARAAFEEPPE